MQRLLLALLERAAAAVFCMECVLPPVCTGSSEGGQAEDKEAEDEDGAGDRGRSSVLCTSHTVQGTHLPPFQEAKCLQLPICWPHMALLLKSPGESRLHDAAV